MIHLDAGCEAFGCNRFPALAGRHLAVILRGRVELLDARTGHWAEAPGPCATSSLLRDALPSGCTGSGLALRHGYDDQAHMARDLRELVGEPMTSLLLEVNQARSGHWPLRLARQPSARAGRRSHDVIVPR